MIHSKILQIGTLDTLVELDTSILSILLIHRCQNFIDTLVPKSRRYFGAEASLIHSLQCDREVGSVVIGSSEG